MSEDQIDIDGDAEEELSGFGSKTSQVLENQIAMAMAHGFEPPNRWNQERLTGLIEDEAALERFKKNQPEAYQEYVEMARMLALYRHTLARKLQAILDNPQEYVDIPNFEWRPGQRNAIEGFIWSFKHGYQRPPFELPTGGGKSHILGAVTRAYIETLQEFEIEDEVEIILLTSRQNLVDQLMGQEEAGDAESEEEEEGDAVNIGDVRLWVQDVLEDDDMRILAGDTARTRRESEKDAALTIETYQGLTENRIESAHQDRQVQLVLLDEAHNATERVRMLINEFFSGALLVGGSATLEGPRRNPFLLFEDHWPYDDATYPDKLSSHDTAAEMMNRGELKPLRWLEGNIDIDLDAIDDDIEGSTYEERVSKLMLRKIEALKEFIRVQLEETEDTLKAMNTKIIQERTSIAFVPRVEIARHLCDHCNEELGFAAEYTWGDDPEFEDKKARLASGEIKVLFSCRKLTEGFDVKEVNCVWGLWPLPQQSEWLLKQMIGRGTRFNEEDPHDDCLFIDGLYNGDRHDLASVLGAFGVYGAFQGGLVAPGSLRNIERKMFGLLQEGIALHEMEEHLEPEEMQQAMQLGWNFEEPAEPSEGGGMRILDDDDTVSVQVDWIEREEVRAHLACSNPEIRHQLAIEALAANGYTDRQSLLDGNPHTFTRQDFGHFGRGLAFISAVIDNRTRGFINKDDLQELADLFFPVDSVTEREALHQEHLAALINNGYNDRQTLLSARSTQFRKKEFGRFGKGLAFYNSVFSDQPKIRKFKSELIIELANRLFPIEAEVEAEDLHQEYLAALRENDYVDRQSLLSVKPSEFQSKTFGRFGKGVAFFNVVTDNNITKVTKSCIMQFANRFFPVADLAEDLHQEYLAALRENDYVDRQSLLSAKLSDFESKTFGRFGKIKRFYRSVIRERVANLKISHLEELADHFFPVGAEEDKPTPKGKKRSEKNGDSTTADDYNTAG